MKRCSKCQLLKDYSDFGKDSHSPAGIRYQCKECVCISNRYWKMVNKAKVRDYNIRYYASHKQETYYRCRSWNVANKVCIAKRDKDRYRKNSLYRLRRLVSNRTRAAFTNYDLKKPRKTNKLLGCTYGELYKYIEVLFRDGMSWENREQWHIDHIIPLASAANEQELIKLCHYTNLQPLWAIDNLRKGAKIL